MVDFKLDIATASTRKTKRWQNQRVTWEEFCNRLRKPLYTAETYEEYLAASKDRQSEIKDVGGFVGGFLDNGIRKPSSVRHRSMLTLDMDYAVPNVWDDITLLYDCAMCLYSTHKHSPESPRYRLIIPLDRPVSSEEYMAIGRWVAGELGIEQFDDTTYDPSRLMYWPSTSKGAEYVFEEQKGEFLCADLVLANYTDWRDSSSWPYSARARERVERQKTEAEDPLTKSGIIGAFCRAYTISEAIERYLSDHYTGCDTEGRYTYKHGSSSAGLIIYDDKFAYSHHATDPICGMLVNAFDLVRIHLYGSQDERSKEDTPISSLPSFKAMSELASSDELVRKIVVSEKVDAARSDFANIGDNDDFTDDGDEDDAKPVEGSEDWMGALELTKAGAVKATAANILTILENDTLLKGCFAYNEFTHRTAVMRDLPWRKLDHSIGEDCLREVDDSGLRSYFETTYGIVASGKIQDALNLAIEKSAFHPIRSYLSPLVWDGVPRVETLFIDYLGVEDTFYSRAVARKSLVAAVARIFEPGVKYDYVPIIVGEQGIGKSTLLRKLGRGWFSDTFKMGDGKDMYEQLQGVWLIEIGELDGLRKAEVETIKLYISKQWDTFRPAYARRVEVFKRQCVFFGTTNEEAFLRDSTGNRRFLPLRTGEIEPRLDVFKLTDETVTQIWAEAMHLYRNKETLYLDSEGESMARVEQGRHFEADERRGIVADFISTKVPKEWSKWKTAERRNWLNTDESVRAVAEVERDGITIMEVWCECFGNPVGNITRQGRREVRDILRALGYSSKDGSKKRDTNYGVQAKFTKEASALPAKQMVKRNG